MQKVLFAVSEVHPLIKTGGLADVAGSLPASLCEQRNDVRIIMPNYHGLVEKIGRTRCMARIPMSEGEVRILLGQLPGTEVRVWLVDYPGYFDRPGNPYLDPQGDPWSDNAERFALFCRVVVEIAMQRTRLKWRPDIIHCHDWQTGLVPALLSLEQEAPPVVYTIHNLSYQGLFPYSTYERLGLPESLWSYEALEFHDQLSFMKGGLVFSDHITTVSPTYAQEIQTPEYGCGLEGLLQYRSDAVSGILNGIDTEQWNPETDPYLQASYSVRDLSNKLTNKKALLAKMGLPQRDGLLIGMVGRLVEQKGIDMVIDALPSLMQLPIQLVLLGSGERQFEKDLSDLAEEYPEQLAIRIGYDESLAHLIEAGSDVFLMPSRFEPCGLNQMYSLRYGTLPIVRQVGGLADTVVHASGRNRELDEANGFVFSGDRGADLLGCVHQALDLFDDKLAWKRMQITAMLQDHSWYQSAQDYTILYKQLMH